MEKEIDTLIIYTIVKTPGCGAEPHIMALERAGRGVRGTSGGRINLFYDLTFFNRRKALQLFTNFQQYSIS